MKFIFGPVASRRFGTSLGIDLSPDRKQCNFDCLYCELAPAAPIERYDTVYPPEEIVAELSEALKEHPNTEVITLTANGEPTLYPHLSELIDQIDAIKAQKQTLILTNSAALIDKNIFVSLLKLDQVKLSLDAVTPDVFTKIDRPHADIQLDKLVEAVIEFSQQYQGRLFIEILFVHGLNDTPDEIAALNKVLNEIECERIDIGTIDRPPAYPIQGISFEKLFEISQQFDAQLPIHIASRKTITSEPSHYSKEEILNTLDKRPLSPDDTKLLFDEQSLKTLQLMIDEGDITITQISNIDFYIPTSNQKRKRTP